VAAKGYDAVWRLMSTQAARNTNSSGDSVPGMRGNALDTQTNTSYIDMDLNQHKNPFYKVGTFLLTFRPQFGYDCANYQKLFELNVSGGEERVMLNYRHTDDIWQAECDYGVPLNVLSSAYTADTEKALQQWHTIIMSWDYDRNFLMLMLDGNVIGTAYGMDTAVATDPVKFTVGTDDLWTVYPADILIDEVKTFSGCIVPYGAFDTGFELQNNYDNAHSDIKFYYNCEASGANASQIPSGKTITLRGIAAIVSTDPLYGTNHLDCAAASASVGVSVSSSDVIDPTHGCISMWLNVQTLPSALRYFFGTGSATDILELGLTSSNYWYMRYMANSVTESITGSVAVEAGEWYHVLAQFSDSNNDGFIRLWINGVSIGTDAVANAFTFAASETMYIGEDRAGTGVGIDCFIEQVFITGNPYTPQILTSFGKPITIPQLKVDGVLKQLGTDYEITHTPDLSLVVSQAGDVTA
jgi:hypothetical protein